MPRAPCLGMASFCEVDMYGNKHTACPDCLYFFRILHRSKREALNTAAIRRKHYLIVSKSLPSISTHQACSSAASSDGVAGIGRCGYTLGPASLLCARTLVHASYKLSPHGSEKGTCGLTSKFHRPSMRSYFKSDFG